MSGKATSSDEAVSDRTVIIVEGETDKERLQQVLREPVVIICTGGTMSYRKMEERILPLQESEVFILVDADDSGMKLRSQLKQALPNAKHLYTRKMYREVATTPLDVLANLLHHAHIEVDAQLFIEPINKHGSQHATRMRMKRKRGLHGHD